MSISCLGLVFPNTNDESLSGLTAIRSVGSVPFGGRYRLIDFALSNLVNSGIAKVGIVTTNNYQSLMDHIGSGRAWDLDRKINGVHFIPPFIRGEVTLSSDRIGSCARAISFLKRSKEEYVIMCDADLVANIDLEPMMKQHEVTGADFTMAYAQTKEKSVFKNKMLFDKIDASGRINQIRMTDEEQSNGCSYSLNVIIVKRELLINVVTEAASLGQTSFARSILQAGVDKYKIYGYKVDEYAKVITNFESYVKITNEVLQSEDVRNQLFNVERPILTKVRDDMPAKYGLNSNVVSSMVANGCIIDGQVKNSVLFRGVKIGKNAVVENCIIMQDCVIGDGVQIKNITIDKDVQIKPNTYLNGADDYSMYIKKGVTI